jgi:cell division cycle 14
MTGSTCIGCESDSFSADLGTDPCSFAKWDSSISLGRQGPRAAFRLQKDNLRVSDLPNGLKRPALEFAPIHHHIIGRVHLVTSSDVLQKEFSKPKVSYFSIEGVLTYPRFFDDFGPMSLGTISRFCTILDAQLKQTADQPVAMTTSFSKESITNAVFLLGAYMIFKHKSELSDLTHAFAPVMHKVLAYRDVSAGKPTFALHLEDCWGGLLQARNLGWVDFGAGPGAFDLSRYELLDDPLNADLHEVVPGKIVAMRGPVSLPAGRRWADVADASGSFSHREISPAHYAPVLRSLGVRAVIRLNSPRYDAAALRAAGFAFADLPFPDGTPPPPAVIAKFLAAVDAVPGAVAVHCRAGLGRTGTLVALYLIRNHGFTARQAMGWLRVVRPGSVIGGQQAFLCAKEPLLRRPGRPYSDVAARAAAAGFGPPTTPTTPTSPCAGSVQRRVDAALDAVDARVREYAAGRAGGRPAADAEPAGAM